MNKEQQEIWDKLKYGVFPGSVQVYYIGNGKARSFNSSWISDAKLVRVKVDDVAQSQYRDFGINVNTICFTQPPEFGAQIEIECYGDKDS